MHDACRSVRVLDLRSSLLRTSLDGIEQTGVTEDSPSEARGASTREGVTAS